MSLRETPASEPQPTKRKAGRTASRPLKPADRRRLQSERPQRWSIAPPAKKNFSRGNAMRVFAVVVGTLLVTALAAIYPWVDRGGVWRNVEWRHAWVLFTLLVVPIVWWRSTFGQDHRRPRLRIGTVRALRTGPRGNKTRLRDLPGILRTVAVVFFVVALARPVAVLGGQTVDEKGIDIVVVMDLSGSMQAVLDADPRDLPSNFRVPKNRRLTRLDTAKIVVRDFIARRQTDRIGVIVFGKSAYVLSPPTLDYQLLSHMVSRLSLNVIDGSKTALGDALGTAVARLRRSDALSKVVIMLTDGDSNAGSVSPDYAIELANTVGSKAYTVQIGDGAEVEVQYGVDLFGNPKYVRRRYPTNPELLQRIATKTGGEAFVATDAKALRKSFHTILDKLEQTRFEASIGHYKDLFALFLIPGVILIAIELLLRVWLLRRFP